jgi:hypothetical protein
MVRKAGAAFDSKFNSAPLSFRRLLDAYDDNTARLRSLASQLVDQIHAAVPRCQNAEDRRLLLKLKRAVFNRRTIASLPWPGGHLELQQHAADYQCLLAATDAQLSGDRECALSEIRSWLAALVEDTRFNAAVRYSCPWLLGVYERDVPIPEHKISRGERGVYAYAMKLFSKANPFYTFASIAFPGEQASDRPVCEVAVNVSLVLLLEKLALRATKHSDRLLALSSHWYESGRFQFLIAAQAELRFAKFADTPPLRALVEYLDAGHEPTFEGAVDCLIAQSSALTRDAAEQYLLALIEKSILSEYLVKDLDRFECLAGLERDLDPLVRQLQSVHRTWVPAAGFDEVQRVMEAVSLPPAIPPESVPASLYYVNSYDRCDTSGPEAAAKELFGDLRAVSPFFTASNCGQYWQSFQGFILEQLAAAPQQQMYYGDLLRAFLRDPVSRGVPRPADPQRIEQQSSANAWYAHLAELTGELSDAQVASLVSSAPPQLDRSLSLCFNGPYDYRIRRFYLANIWAGNGRFAARFNPARQARRLNVSSSTDGALDVQLVIPLKDNRDDVAPISAVGCGFESRYRHNFERWIDAAGIIVESSGDKIVYRDRASGRTLRFHYVGFVVAECLPVQFALLLAGHADYYKNPFNRIVETGEDGGATYLPGVTYGHLCLRRQQWLFPASTFSKVKEQTDAVQSTLDLREIIFDCAAGREEHWYVRPYIPAIGMFAKPRYLNLANPLSVSVFQHTLSSLTPGTILSLSPMEPPLSGLFEQDGQRYVTELMIEV